MSYILDALKKSEQERGHGQIPDVQTIHSAGIAYRRDKASWWPYVLIFAVVLNLAAIVYFNIRQPGHPATGNVPGIAGAAQNTATEVSQTPPAPLDETAGTQTVTRMPAARQDTQAVTAPDTAAASAGDTSAPEPLFEEAVRNKPPVTETPAGATATAAFAREAEPNETLAQAQGRETGPLAANQDTAAPRQSQAIENDAEALPDYNDLPESTRKQIPVIHVTAHVYSSNPQQRSIVINNNFMEEGEYVLDGLILEEITRTGAIFSYQDLRFHYNVVSGWQ